MDLDDLELFVYLADHQHAGEAATRYHVSQPTVSRSLSRVERVVGTPLFERRGGRLHLNRYGQIAASHARALLDEWNRGCESIRQLIDPNAGEVRLAFLHSLGMSVVPDVLLRFRQLSPGISFALHAEAADVSIQQLRDGLIDFFLTAIRPECDDLEWCVIGREQLYVAVPHSFNIASATVLNVSQLARYQFILPKRESNLCRLIIQLCNDAGFEPEVCQTGAELATIRGFVAAGLGIAILPIAPTSPGFDKVAYVPLTECSAYRDIGFSWLKDRHETPVVARFANFIDTLSREAEMSHEDGHATDHVAR